MACWGMADHLRSLDSALSLTIILMHCRPAIDTHHKAIFFGDESIEIFTSAFWTCIENVIARIIIYMLFKFIKIYPCFFHAYCSFFKIPNKWLLNDVVD